MKLGELVLRAFSRNPENMDYSSSHDDYSCYRGNALALVKSEYPNFLELVTRKRVVDFGCGQGHQSIALVTEADCFVCGVDTNSKTLHKAIAMAGDKSIPGDRLRFCTSMPAELRGTFDVVISQDSMEHFPDPAAVLDEMKALIKEDGRLLITFGPPWFAPYGSHMNFFCRLPWINILFSEKTVMKVRSLFRNDGAARYVEVESGLNKMTVAKFEKLVADSGLVIETIEYKCVKRLNFTASIPLMRELFINHVSCILVKPRRSAHPI
jgi:SAM-dependent methyltransferase